MKSLASLITAAIMLVLVFAGANKIESMSCHAKWEGAFPVTYSFMGGCKVQTPDGKWIPAENYREVK